MDRRTESRSRLPFGLSWEKLVIWTLFACVVYALRNFFSIVFMTFLMSYVAQRLASFVTRGKSDSWIRRPVIVLIYTAALVMLYFSGQFVLPRAIEQGKWLLGQVQALNLDRIRDEVLANTLGRVELARYKRTDNYRSALSEYLQKKSTLPSLADFSKVGADIRKTFRDELVAQEGRLAIDELQRSKRFDELYREWVRQNRAERELTAQPQLRQQLEEEFDKSWRYIYGEESFQQNREAEQYIEQRRVKVLSNVTDELVSEGRYRDEAVVEIGARLGAERVGALSSEETERRFRDFYTVEVPRRWSSFPFSYEKFASLEKAGGEEEFQTLLGAEKSTTKTPEDEFDAALQLRLAKEHPWSELLGDTSQLVRDNMPRITGWLTNAINNIIGFGLDALLSLVFSAMIVWEIPRTRRSLGRVYNTRAEPIYLEIAPGVQRLGEVIGTAFTAQMLIAALNAAFTFVAISFLGLPSPLFLSLLVLFFSLVPYVGIIVAAVPILLVALQSGGIQLGLYAALAMFIIHELEAWILGPKILGDVLNLNPIAVILVLFVGQQLFGVWGLLLAVPVAVFLINDVMLQPAGSPLGTIREAATEPARQV